MRRRCSRQRRVELRSSSGSETSTHLAGSAVVTVVRRLAKQEHSASLPPLASRISGIGSLVLGLCDSIREGKKGLITDLISLLHEEASSEARSSVQSCCL